MQPLPRKYKVHVMLHQDHTRDPSCQLPPVVRKGARSTLDMMDGWVPSVRFIQPVYSSVK